MNDTQIQEILSELDAAHIATGYHHETTYSASANAIRHLLRERECLLSDLYYTEKHGTEVPC